MWSDATKTPVASAVLLALVLLASAPLVAQFIQAFDAALILALSALATTAAAVAAWRSVFVSAASLKQEQMSRRPYLNVSGALLYDEDPWRVELNLANQGGRPAEGIQIAVLLVTYDDALPHVNWLDTINRGENLPTGDIKSKFVLSYGEVTLSPRNFFVLLIHYVDPLGARKFEQSFFLKWGTAWQPREERRMQQVIALERIDVGDAIRDYLVDYKPDHVRWPRFIEGYE